MKEYLSSRILSVSNPREVWLVTAAHAVNELYSIALPPILPLLVNDFSISYSEAGALLTVFFITYSIFQLPAGLLADRIGQRWLLAGGMVILAMGILVVARAQNYEMLVVGEAIAGIGGSTYHPTGMSLISDLESGDTEGKAMGIHGLGGVVGTALAPALIGGLTALFDWRLALTVSAMIGIIYAAVFLALFRAADDTDMVDRTEMDGERSTKADSRNRTSLSPFVSVPSEPWVLMLFLTTLIVSIEIGAVRTFITSYLVEHAGTTATTANGIFFVMLVGAGLASLGGGSLADTVDRRSLGFATMILSTIAIGSTAFVPLIPVVLFMWFFLLGIVIWATLPAMNAIISEYSQQEFSGGLFGVMVTAGSLGGAGGPLLFGLTAERLGIDMAFPLIAGTSIAGALAFLSLYRIRYQTTVPPS